MNVESAWKSPPPPPPASPALTERDVQVWRIFLDQPPAVVARLRSLLAPDELGRAERFRAAQLEEHFIVSRGSLRTIAGRSLGIAPSRLSFDYGPHGKPMIAARPNDVPLTFNLAHSHGIALLAVSLTRQLGIDIERVRPLDDFERIIVRYFSASERAEFLALPERLRLEAFFRGWTRKEAYMKAIGMGFSMPLDQFSVTVSPCKEPRLLHVAGRPREEDRWRFVDIDPAPGYQGAIAVEGTGWALHRFQHEPEDSVVS
jgi:4'-phosphopantetheinyl transferase